ncbi:hypothetical protein BV25DRAFT_1787109, partial [Artomyces pyxidatus]
MSLVLWIAIKIWFISALLAYVDDAFSHDRATRLALYAPYDAWYPPKQVRLLQLWDFLGIPHEKEKQVFGRSLVITGFLVDPRNMSISLERENVDKLITAVRDFVLNAPGRRRPLVEWWRMLGWMNWALNVAPLLRPGLASAYAKTAGMTIRNAKVFINAAITRDWLWFADCLEHWDGIHILRARTWSGTDADL